MTILIPYVRSEDNELKYALRSIEKFQPESDVVLIGDRPSWYNGNHIYHSPNSLTKQLNVRDKIIKANIDDFTLWYDDVYQIKDGPIIKTNYGKLSDHSNKETLGEWFSANIKNTMLVYPEGLYYGNHYPIEMNLQKFKEAMRVDWKRDYLVKSLYGNYVNHAGEYLTDCKFRHGDIRAFISDKQFFSTGSIKRNVINLLEELFPHKSKNEK